MEGLSKTPDEIKKGLEALDKMQFFMGQRAGRELWMDKPHDVQEKDLESFNHDVETVRGLVQHLKRERDALLEGLKRADLGCEYCKHCNSSVEPDADKCPCNKCRDNSLWEWAGIKEDLADG